jgi:hypothetical protein
LDSVSDFIPFGDNLDRDADPNIAIADILTKLERRLSERGRAWAEVSLLMLTNSFVALTHEEQQRVDQAIKGALTRFCAQREWFPSLIGTTVYSSFFGDESEQNLDIADGVQFVAVLCDSVPRIPVAFEVSASVEQRRDAGLNVVKACLHAYRELISVASGDPGVGPRPSTGILFTSGSGHVEASEDIDFTECYALGQELLGGLADPPHIIGGCASSKSGDYFQCLYYSQDTRDGVRYESTYQHAAVFALIPHAESRYVLQHPFQQLTPATPLDIVWDHKDKYEDGRYYYVESINGRAPVDFLAGYWKVPKDQLLKMEQDHTPIPLDERTFLYTIASSRRADDRIIWPNVPVWFEKVNGKTMLRLVRAEESTSNFYLMVMGEVGPERTLRRASEQALTENCVDLVNHFRAFNRDGDGRATMLSFLCESRKVLLDKMKSNMEAEFVTGRLPRTGQMIGIYLNGEYSVGSAGSIGYHNFSQISAIIPHAPASVAAVPHGAAQAGSLTPVPAYAGPPVPDRAGALDMSEWEESYTMASTPAAPGPSGPRLNGPGPIAQDSGPLPQSPGPMPQSPGPMPQSPGPMSQGPGPMPHSPAPMPQSPGHVSGRQYPNGSDAAPGPRGPLPPYNAPASAMPASSIPASGPGYRNNDDLFLALNDLETAAADREAAAKDRETAAELRQYLSQTGTSVDGHPHTQMPDNASVRVVVTGSDHTGHATFAADHQLAPVTSPGLPGAEVYYVWGSDTPPVLPTDGHQDRYAGHFPPPNGVRYILYNLAPQSSFVEAGAHTRQAREDAVSKFPGLLETFDPYVEGMHASETVDFVIVLAGEVVLELDNQAQKHLSAGDVVVQNGTRHRWINPGPAPARLAFVLIGAHTRQWPGGPSGHR